MTRLRFTTTTLSARDPRALAGFYESLLGWRRTTDEPGWVVLAGPGDDGHRLAFHIDDEHVAPVWPSRPGAPTMQAHVEIATDDLDGAVRLASDLGARAADVQPLDGVRVMLDPAGHPFCLFIWPDLPEN